MTDRFRWHPDARLHDSAGREVRPLPSKGPVLPDSADGLAQAIGLSAFRIGAPERTPPDTGERPVFETLTSGSTGQPRRIRRSQASWIASFSVNAGLGIGPGARVAVLGRLVHSLALYGAIEGLHLGAEVHLLDALRPDRQRQALGLRRVTHLYATPAQLRLLVGPGSLSDLRLILVGGSKLDAALRAAITALAPQAQVREFYGAAETSFITLADTATPGASVGRPYPGVELSLDPSGEVWVKSPYLFERYADDPRSPADASQSGQGIPAADQPIGSTRWRDGWLSVGEVGQFKDGFLFLKGRAGRMVTVADQNVFPEEIEAFLATLPGITRAAVLPRPDARRGTVLIALAQGDPGREAAILADLRQELGPLKAPKALIWLDDWPVLPSGKTDLRALEALARWPA
ncbi:MAG: AMP-binding protein [Tabrizicola sp.]|nr:AMP-binding protein [Tabrizicola sp.]